MKPRKYKLKQSKGWVFLDECFCPFCGSEERKCGDWCPHFEFAPDRFSGINGCACGKHMPDETTVCRCAKAHVQITCGGTMKIVQVEKPE